MPSSISQSNNRQYSPETQSGNYNFYQTTTKFRNFQSIEQQVDHKFQIQQSKSQQIQMPFTKSTPNFFPQSSQSNERQLHYQAYGNNLQQNSQQIYANHYAPASINHNMNEFSLPKKFDHDQINKITRIYNNNNNSVKTKGQQQRKGPKQTNEMVVSTGTRRLSPNYKEISNKMQLNSRQSNQANQNSIQNFNPIGLQGVGANNPFPTVATHSQTSSGMGYIAVNSENSNIQNSNLMNNIPSQNNLQYYQWESTNNSNAPSASVVSKASRSSDKYDDTGTKVKKFNSAAAAAVAAGVGHFPSQNNNNYSPKSQIKVLDRQYSNTHVKSGINDNGIGSLGAAIVSQNFNNSVNSYADSNQATATQWRQTPKQSQNMQSGLMSLEETAMMSSQDFYGESQNINQQKERALPKKLAPFDDPTPRDNLHLKLNQLSPNVKQNGPGSAAIKANQNSIKEKNTSNLSNLNSQFNNPQYNDTEESEVGSNHYPILTGGPGLPAGAGSNFARGLKNANKQKFAVHRSVSKNGNEKGTSSSIPREDKHFNVQGGTQQTIPYQTVQPYNPAFGNMGQNNMDFMQGDQLKGKNSGNRFMLPLGKQATKEINGGVPNIPIASSYSSSGTQNFYRTEPQFNIRSSNNGNNKFSSKHTQQYKKDAFISKISMNVKNRKQEDSQKDDLSPLQESQQMIKDINIQIKNPESKKVEKSDNNNNNSKLRGFSIQQMDQSAAVSEVGAIIEKPSNKSFEKQDSNRGNKLSEKITSSRNGKHRVSSALEQNQQIRKLEENELSDHYDDDYEDYEVDEEEKLIKEKFQKDSSIHQRQGSASKSSGVPPPLESAKQPRTESFQKEGSFLKEPKIDQNENQNQNLNQDTGHSDPQTSVPTVIRPNSQNQHKAQQVQEAKIQQVQSNQVYAREQITKAVPVELLEQVQKISQNRPQTSEGGQRRRARQRGPNPPEGLDHKPNMHNQGQEQQKMMPSMEENQVQKRNLIGVKDEDQQNAVKERGHIESQLMSEKQNFNMPTNQFFYSQNDFFNQQNIEQSQFSTNNRSSNSQRGPGQNGFSQYGKKQLKNVGDDGEFEKYSKIYQLPSSNKAAQPYADIFLKDDENPKFKVKKEMDANMQFYRTENNFGNRNNNIRRENFLKKEIYEVEDIPLQHIDGGQVNEEKFVAPDKESANALKDNFLGNDEDCQIIIRHNQSAVGRRKVVKQIQNVPFRSNLGQDFLSLFA